METNKMFEIKEPLELMPFEDKESQYWYVKYLSNSLEQYRSKSRAYEALLKAHTNEIAMLKTKNTELRKEVEKLQADLEYLTKG